MSAAADFGAGMPALTRRGGAALLGGLVFEGRFDATAVLERVVMQADAAGAAASPGVAYVVAAYVVTAVLLLGYGGTLWWRQRLAARELAFWRREAALDEGEAPSPTDSDGRSGDTRR